MAHSRPWAALFWGSALLLSVLRLSAQETAALPAALPAAPPAGDPAALIGLSLEGLVVRYGIPQSVYAVRGVEAWQDDVVFVYAAGDFYVYRDRVWQLGLKAAYGIKAGDPRGLIPLVLGAAVEDQGDHILCPLYGWDWPLTLRFNLNGSGAVSAIYIYRSDM